MDEMRGLCSAGQEPREQSPRNVCFGKVRPAFFAPGSVGDENRVVRRTETVLEQVAHDHVGLFGNKLAAHGVFEVLRFGGKAYDF